MSDQIISALEKVTEGDESFMKELSQAFMTNFEEFSNEIATAVDDADLTAYRALVHKVKPSFLTIELNEEFDRIDNFSDQLDQKTEEEKAEFKAWTSGVTKNILDALKKLA